MNKQEFKTTQPVVYRVLSNALKNRRLAHAYMFTGPKSAPKADVALLFAQSILCSNPDEDGFACQACTSCQRIEKEESLNFFWVHHMGADISKTDIFDQERRVKKMTQERIKKKDILALQQFFESTSVETKEQRVYILEDYDQATPDASNSLLKFLEEPAPNIFGILIADEKSNVLPTIQSRCQMISFRPTSYLHTFESLTDATSAAMLTQSGYTLDRAKEVIDDKTFMIIKEAAYHYVKHWKTMDIVLDMQTNVFPSKAETTSKQWVRVWLEWLLFIIKNEPLSIDESCRVQIQMFLVESMDTLRSPVDINLFLDNIYFQIRKVVCQ